MKRRLIIRDAALAEVQAAKSWYEQQRSGLGDDFGLCVDETIERVRRNPEAFAKIDQRLRRALVHRFPYGVFYSISDEEIIIHAVLHGSRSPRNWTSRD